MGVFDRIRNSVLLKEGDSPPQAGDRFVNQKWGEKGTVGKALTVGLLSNPLAAAGLGISAIGRNERRRLYDINKMIEDAEKSPYNEASVSKENQTYYDTVMSELSRVKRLKDSGLTDDEINNIQNIYSRNVNLGAQNAMNASGGSLSKYINANLNANQNDFALGLSSQNQGIKRQQQQFNENLVNNYINELGQASQASQRANDMNFQKQILAEQALGEAKKDWYTMKQMRNKQGLDVGMGVAKIATEALT